jgi:hypothetical protein
MRTNTGSAILLFALCTVIPIAAYGHRNPYFDKFSRAWNTIDHGKVSDCTRMPLVCDVIED